jgi:hypothetical protein
LRFEAIRKEVEKMRGNGIRKWECGMWKINGKKLRRWERIED